MANHRFSSRGAAAFLTAAAIAVMVCAGRFAGTGRSAAPDQPAQGSPFRSQTVDLAAYHPAGDGVTDDASLLQAAVNATPPGGTLLFGAGRRYAVSRPIDCRGKAIHIDAANSTVVITNAQYPNNAAFHFGALLAGAPGIGRPYNAQQPPPPSATFSGHLAAGEFSFPCTLPPVITTGSYVCANFGTCPTDHTLPDVSYIARVTGISPGTITLDAPLPRDVHGDTHSFYGVVSLGDNSSIQNIGLDWARGITPDVQISVDYCRNFRAENLFGRFSIAVNSTYSRDVVLDRVNGELVLTSPSAGRVFGGWLVEGFSVSNVVVTQSKNAAIFFLEGCARDGLIDNVILNSTVAGPWGEGVFQLDGTQNLIVRGLSINAARGAQVTLDTDGTSGGANHSGMIFENVRTNAPLAIADLREIKGGVINNIPLGEPVTLHYSIPLTGSSGRVVPLAKGVIRRLYVKLPEHVTAIHFRPNSAGPSITEVHPGAWQPLVSGFSDYRWNDPARAGLADCAITDDGHLPPDAKIEVMCDVFPAGQDVHGE